MKEKKFPEYCVNIILSADYLEENLNAKEIFFFH